MKPSFLDDLEDRVQQASDRLRELRDDNTELKKRIRSLEKEARVAAEAADDSGVWETERTEIRRRVERLAEGLKELLAD